MAQAFDDLYQIFTPSGGASNCSTIIAAAGGWDNITAEQATALSQFGCYPGFIDQQQDFYTGFDTQEPSAAAGDAGGVAVALPQDSIAPINDPEQQISEVPVNFSTDPSELDNPIQWLAPIVSGFSPLIAAQGTGQNTDPSFGQVLEQAAKTVLPMFFQNDQITAGITSFSGPNSCWNPGKSGKLSRRAQVKIVRTPQGVQLVKYCRPKRMNPLNPRALRRAASRLGSFHRIASHIEKLVQKACKTSARRRAPRMGCAPKRCR